MLCSSRFVLRRMFLSHTYRGCFKPPLTTAYWMVVCMHDRQMDDVVLFNQRAFPIPLVWQSTRTCVTYTSCVLVASWLIM